jgi:hypothetical protein
VKDLGLAACNDTILAQTKVEIQLKKLTTCAGMPPITAGREPDGTAMNTLSICALLIRSIVRASTPSKTLRIVGSAARDDRHARKGRGQQFRAVARTTAKVEDATGVERQNLRDTRSRAARMRSLSI